MKKFNNASDILFLSGFALLLCLSLYIHFLSGDATEDKEISFYSARAWLEGKTLYRDIFTVQPPLIIYLYAVPVYLSRHIGLLQDFHYLTLLGCIAIAYILWLILTIMRLHPAFMHDRRRQTQLCLLIIAACIIFQNPFYFLDREHIFFMLTLPYVLRFMPSVARQALPLYVSMAIGILAGIGFCFKPQCFIVFAGINLACIWHDRSGAILKSPENIAVYLITSAYLLFMSLATPEYFTVVVPMAIATYSASSRKLQGLIFFACNVLSFGITFSSFDLRRTSPYRKDIFYLSWVALCLLAYILTNNGWAYTWSLLNTMAILINGFVLWEYCFLRNQDPKSMRAVFGIRACVIAFAYNAAVIPFYMYSALAGCQTILTCAPGQQFLQKVKETNPSGSLTSFGTISVDFTVWPYLNRVTGARWDTRFNHLWMFPRFFLSDKDFAEKNAWIINYVAQGYAEDLRNNRPQIVFVDDTDNFYTAKKYVDLVAFLGVSSQFIQEWSHYRYINRIDVPLTLIKHHSPHHGYLVYERIN